MDAPPKVAATAAVGDRPRRLAAIMFLDMVGYSALMARDETRALACVRALEATLRDLVPRHGGRVVKFMGDGSMAEFPTARHAVDGARAVQAAVETKARDCADCAGMRVRIGIHIGEVVEGDGGDLFGDAVNIAARVQPLAMPGGLAMTDAVHQQIRGQLALGDTHQLPARLKNLPDRTRVVLVAPEGQVVPRGLRWRRPLRLAMATCAIAAVVGPAAWFGWRALAPKADKVGILFVEAVDSEVQGASAIAREIEAALDQRLGPRFQPEWVAPAKIQEIYACLGLLSQDMDSRLIHACPAVRRGGLAFVFTGRVRPVGAGWKLTLSAICTEGRKPIKEFVAEGPDAATLADRISADKELDIWIRWFMQPPA